jgi:putative NIF3 family GTP cyclohydrolase 1 type 2
VAGAPTTLVTGVAFTAMPTVAVLQEARARGLNMIVTPESPLFARPLTANPTPGAGAPASIPRDALAGDRIRDAKRAFVEQNGLVVYQLADNLAARSPDLMVQGLARAMGWPQTAASAVDPRIYAIAPTTLRAMIGQAKQRLGVDGGLRYVGEPDMAVRRVLVIPGTAEVVSMVKATPQVDLVLTGDIREWEGVNYVYDSLQMAEKKALVAVGRYLSEQPGIAQAADWLRPALRGLPVETIAPKDPYWRLA